MSDSETLRTVACQILLSMGFSRQEYLWVAVPFSNIKTFLMHTIVYDLYQSKLKIP